MPPPNFHRLQEEMEEVSMMMKTLMVNKFNCFSNYGFFVICYEEMEEEGKMIMIKTLVEKQVQLFLKLWFLCHLL